MYVTVHSKMWLLEAVTHPYSSWKAFWKGGLSGASPWPQILYKTFTNVYCKCSRKYSQLKSKSIKLLLSHAVKREAKIFLKSEL